jgi:nucleotide-binding universal stress UspA family protein
MLRLMFQENREGGTPMMPKDFKRILCPVDFSPHSRQALAHAATFVRASLGKLFVFHAIDDPLSAFYLAETAPVLPHLHESERVARIDLFNTAIRRGTEMLQNFAPDITAGCNCQYLVECDDPYKRIIEIAQEDRIDLIVMGTHGRTGIGHLAMGSVAEKVVRTARCPVLTVHAFGPEEQQVRLAV